MEYMEQKQGSTCVAVAIVNTCRYLGLNSPDFDDLTKELCCVGGAAIGVSTVINRVFGKRLVKCDFRRGGLVKPFRRGAAFSGGILMIMHPIVNLHALFYYPEGEGFTLVNSWLGPNVFKNVGLEEIARFLPSNPNDDFWKLS